MSYIINTANNRVERLSQDNKNSSYKNIKFNKMKDAYNYKTHIMNSPLEEMGIITYDTSARLYNEYLVYIEELTQKKLDCEEILADRVPQYKNGFFNTAEWKERERLNKEYIKLKKEYSAIILEGLEYFHINIVKQRPNEVHGTSTPLILSALYNNDINAYSDIPDLDRYLENWRKKAFPLSESIDEVKNNYRVLNDRTSTGRATVDNLKNQAIRIEEEIKFASNRLEELYVQNMIKVPGQNIYVFKQVKDLNIGDVIVDDGRYNILYYVENTEETFSINYVANINSRLAIVTNKDNILLRNNDWVVIDSSSKGDIVNSDILNLSRPFFNVNEVVAYRPEPKDYDGSDRMKSMFGLEDKNSSI